MARLFATALTAVTVIGLGIVSLSYQQQELDSTALTNSSADAYNLTTQVTQDTAGTLASAMPRLLAVTAVVLILMLLVLNR